MVQWYNGRPVSKTSTDHSFLDLQVSEVNLDGLIMQLEKISKHIIIMYLLFLPQINFQEFKQKT